ncbi:BMP family lipoprotein [Halodesulfurarchaeum sp.]|uniref:BMP family lipoprotein n=1 Tax=Halodesulfurarchaeum sp. TaxID=1980530 RepID=UPI002FC38CFF
MGSYNRRTFLKVAGGIGATSVTAMAGCSGGENTDAETTTEESGSDTTNVGMVYATGGLGDGSFNDQAQQGIIQASEDFAVEYDEAQPEEVSQFGNYQTQFAGSTDPNYDLISTIGFLQTDALSGTAPDYPDQNFMIVDSVVEEDNVASYIFREHEGSYLVGQLAGLLTTSDFSAGAGSTKPDTKSVGFVGGVEGTLIKKFEAGFIAGVKSVDSEIEVQSSYVGSFNEPSSGEETAIAMYESGSDVVYHASGNTGTGVFEAAQSKGRFAIGVDRDQSITKESYADVILASMVKRVDTAVYTAVESVVEGTFESGITTLGLDEGGIAAVYGSELGSEVPQDVKDEIAATRESIIAGDISVPTDPENA